MSENVNTQIYNSNIENKPAEKQNTADNAKTTENMDTLATAKFGDEQTKTATRDTATQATDATSKNSANADSSTQKTASTTNVTKNSPSSADSSKVSSQTSSQNTSNIRDEEKAAAGETKTLTATQTRASFTVTQIKDAATRVKAFIEKNHKLPNYVTIGSSQVQMPEFLKLLSAGLIQLNNGVTTPILFKDINGASQPTETVKSGSITKAGYLDLAKRVTYYLDTNGKLPNYASSSLGKLKSESLIYMFSKVITFQKTNDRLPSYVTVKPWSTITGSSAPVPSSLQKYLVATANCQATNAQIKALAASITAGKTTTYAKAAAIFNWVRDKISYSFYYNTKRGAVGTLNARTGNCVDTAHLLIALERAAGIPARYEHVYARFTSGNWYGHVVAQIYVNGVWYTADGTSSRNTFGVINNWNKGTATLKGIYTSLPF